MAVGAAAVAIVFTVDAYEVQIPAVAVGLLVAFRAISTVPDVVFAQRQPDLTDDSLRHYLKRRQRATQATLLLLLALAGLSLALGMGVLVAEITDDPASGIIIGVIGALGGLAGSLADRDEFWPPEIRG